MSHRRRLPVPTRSCAAARVNRSASLRRRRRKRSFPWSRGFCAPPDSTCAGTRRCATCTTSARCFAPRSPSSRSQPPRCGAPRPDPPPCALVSAAPSDVCARSSVRSRPPPTRATPQRGLSSHGRVLAPLSGRDGGWRIPSGEPAARRGAGAAAARRRRVVRPPAAACALLPRALEEWA